MTPYKTHPGYLTLLLALLAALTCSPLMLQAEPLRVVSENMPPYNYRTTEGQLSGPSTEVVRALLASLKISSKIEVMPWARAYKVALTEPNVLIFSIVRTRQREPHFQWLDGIGPVDIQIFASTNSPLLPFNDLNQLTDKTLGILRSSSQVAFVKSHKGLLAKNIIAGKSYEDLYKMQQLGRVDLIMAPGMLIKYLNHKFSTKAEQLPKSVYIVPSTQQRQLHLAFSNSTEI
ncbi:MAG: polar amino acid transport system substrate-binding protein, partial [Alteromonadaceae bacterium]